MNITLLLLTYIVVFGAIGILIGQRKGRGFAGLVWAMLLGPIGWLLVFLGPDLRPKCPHCQALIEHGASRCGACGERVTWIRGRAIRPSRAVA